MAVKSVLSAALSLSSLIARMVFELAEIAVLELVIGARYASS